ncbi:signal peptidase II [Pedobacter sp. KR3-3]|uniref:Lipoprotein signal peptidase n=1 Tax=Pedobacter albus TaxID=3113905 RepID=A0ABU7I909_9SPHI|nr:signal peptidase II [Pedobacter sp. KR3-3]MEE1945965.1 signal peptidase II [Pedobacter sp. KR3-3]
MMPQRKNLKWILLLLMVALNVGCDQVSKNIVRQRIEYGETISLVKNYFILTKVENTGAFLSAGNELPTPIRFALLTLLPLAVLGYGLYYLTAKKDLPKLMQIGLSFLIGGGIGNVYDRMVHGSVTDFMHMDFVIFRTGVFNVADLSIMTGIAILLIHSLKHKVVKPASTSS